MWAVAVHDATVPGGHFIPEEAPQELATTLGSFLLS
jgi:hypothetical protein